MFERLEPRQLVSVSLENGLLSVIGTPENDRQIVSMDTMSAGILPMLLVDDNGAISRFALANVRSIKITGLAGDDFLAVTDLVALPANISGGEGADILRGGRGNDTLLGDSGNDTLDGGMGADRLLGGGDIDTADYRIRTMALKLSPDGMANDGADTEGDNLGFDLEVIAGGSAGDLITADFNSTGTMPVVPRTFFGNGGNDTLVGGTAPVTLVGGDGADILRGGSAGDMLDGGTGRDVLDGRGGADRLVGGPDVDTADYGARTVTLKLSADALANDGAIGENDNIMPDVEVLVGGSGDDWIHGGMPETAVTASAMARTLIGNAGNDTLVAGRMPTTLLGGDGDDNLRGGPTKDLLDGGAGNDLLDGALGADRLVGGPGFDTADYHVRTEALRLTIDNLPNDGNATEGDNIGFDVEKLVGGNGNDLIAARGSNVARDVAPTVVIARHLIGNAGNDTLVGDTGNDTLAGGAGADRMLGGAGDDLFLAADGTEDYIDGGIGFDRAQVDRGLDVLLGIEELFDATTL